MHSEYNRAMTRLGADLGNGEERAVSSLPVAGAKNGTFRAYMANKA